MFKIKLNYVFWSSKLRRLPCDQILYKHGVSKIAYLKNFGARKFDTGLAKRKLTRLTRFFNGEFCKNS